MTQESPTVTPPPPRPSPYYASSTRHDDDNGNGEQQREEHQQQRKYDERDYEEIYYHFDDYAQDIILANASKFLTPPEPAEHYEWEEAIIDEASQSEWEGMKKSFCFGMGCGLLGFGLLRWRRDRGGFFTRGGRMNNMNMNGMRTTSTGGYKFDPLPPKPQNSAMHHHHQHHYNNNNNNNNSRSGAIIDIVLSTFLGIGTSLLAIESDIFYPKTNTITSNDNNNNIIISPPPQWISPQIPLVPGRSLTADTLCQPLTEEFRKFPKQLWQSGSNQNMGIENGYHNHMALYANSGWKGTKYYKGNDNASIVSLGESNDIGASGTSYDDDHDATNNHPPEEGTYYYERLVLDNLQGFIINCERRSRHEERLRKMKGMRNNNTTTTNYNGTKKTPVVIPGGGVSAEEDLELDDIYYHLIDDGNDDN